MDGQPPGLKELTVELEKYKYLENGTMKKGHKIGMFSVLGAQKWARLRVVTTMKTNSSRKAKKPECSINSSHFSD